jgi:hypothetical protein
VDALGPRLRGDERLGSDLSSPLSCGLAIHVFTCCRAGEEVAEESIPFVPAQAGTQSNNAIVCDPEVVPHPQTSGGPTGEPQNRTLTAP